MQSQQHNYTTISYNHNNHINHNTMLIITQIQTIKLTLLLIILLFSALMYTVLKIDNISRKENRMREENLNKSKLKHLYK